MIKNEKKNEKDKHKRNLKDILIPSVVNFSGTQIQILNNNEAIVEGCKGILEYDDCAIRLNLGKMSVKFSGDKLTVTCMNCDSIVLKGFITAVEFLN